MQGPAVSYNEATTETWQHVYDFTNDVYRAIPLIRDPLDNIVSRYHLGLPKVKETGEEDKNAALGYTYDAQGFANFCDTVSNEHAELTDSYIHQLALHLIKDIIRYHVTWICSDTGTFSGIIWLSSLPKICCLYQRIITCCITTNSMMTLC
jgi:hypothetical protein